MLENMPSQSAMTELLGQSYGILAVRTGLTSINIVEEVKHSAPYTQKVIALVS